MTPRERAYQLRDALRAREIALDVTAVDAVEAAFMADRAERDAVRESACAAYERGLAERVREAVAREREACAQQIAEFFPDDAHKGHILAQYLRARATSPAPEPHPAGRAAADAAKAARARGADVYADGEGRAVIEAAVEWRASLDGPGECWHEARVRDAVDALAAARKGGG